MHEDRATLLSAQRPFPGLRPFGYADRLFFFGREEHIYALYRLFDYSRFVAVVGSSGSGKSSLVRAGLLPMLNDTRGPCGPWRFVVLRPGDSPMNALVGALVTLAGDAAEDEIQRDILRQRIGFALRRSSFGIAKAIEEIPELATSTILIVVDQFEELFRYDTESSASGNRKADQPVFRDEAARFVRLLLEAARDAGRRIFILITMRSDFIGDCSRYFGLPEVVSGSQFLTPALTRDQLEDAIRKPIEKAGGSVDAILIERLLNDVAAEPDQLPVLQHCLLRLWNEAVADAAPGIPRLQEVHYRAVGGIANALSQHADEVMLSLAGHEDAVRLLFQALSERDREGRATRRAIQFGQLLAETGATRDELSIIIDRLRAEDCSFVVTPGDAGPHISDSTRIDVVHEALLRRWDKISGPQGWLALEEADARRYRTLLGLLEGT